MFLTRYLTWLSTSNTYSGHSLSESTGSEVLEQDEPASAKVETVEDLVVPVFPQEIIYEILDHLDTNSRPTLRSCSLVSRSWVEPSRRHLFHTIVFKLRDTFRWIETFPVPERSPAYHVRELSLELGGHYYVPDEFFNRIQWFRNVRGVTMLSGRCNDWWWIPPSGRLSESVTSLTIVSDAALTIPRIRDVMVQLPNLTDLSISGSLLRVGKDRLEGIGTALRGKFRGRLQLHGKLGRSYMDVVNALLEVQTGLNFTELDLQSIREGLVSTVRLTEACEKSLVKLSYTIDHYGKFPQLSPVSEMLTTMPCHILARDGTLDRSFDFAKCRNLKEVILTLNDAGPGLPWIRMALSTIKSATTPHLSALHLNLNGLSRPNGFTNWRILFANDLRLLDEEVARIEREFGGAVNLTANYRAPCRWIWRRVLSTPH